LSSSGSGGLRGAVIDAAGAFLGPLLLLFLRAAQRAANARQLRNCTRVGRGLTVGYDLEVENAGDISIGDDVSILSGALLSCRAGGSIAIGASCFFAKNLTIAAERARIAIAADCLIAENVSIRASNHGIRAGTLIRLQPNVVADITIGRDVWIGAGVTVLAGSSIADGCVIGANSVVRGSTEPNCIYVGSPIRKIGVRTE
jgi:carbonic anhydrase/acetyltransferase-like protein (isoleucine patch superfamily)